MNNGIILLITLVLIISCFFDLKTRKIPNSFNLIVFLASLSLGLSIYGLPSLASFALGAIALMPLYFMGALGGGDYKLFASLSFCIPFSMHVEIFFYALIWAALYGLIKMISFYKLEDWLYQIYLDTKTLFRKKDNARYRIPFTIPYLLGWLSILRLGGVI